MLPTATHRDETAPHAASHRGEASSGAGSKAGSLSPLGCHQALTQSPQQLMGWSPHGSHSGRIPAILCFSGGCQSLGIPSISSEHHHSTTYFSPPAERTFCPTAARRETYSSPSRQSSLRSRSTCYTSDRRRPRTWGYRSGKPGIPEGCGAGHLLGQTHRTRGQLHRAQTHRLKQGQKLPKIAVMEGGSVLPHGVSGHE